MPNKIITFGCTSDQQAMHNLPHKYRAFVAGFGSGKTLTMARDAFMAGTAHKSALIAIFEPTYSLIRTVAAPRLLGVLEENRIKFDYNKFEQLVTPKSDQLGQFMFMSMEVPERIVGFECYAAFIDELDTLKTDHAESAWNAIIARTRQVLPGSPTNRVSCYTTPEGFRFVYNRWVKNSNPEYGMVQASSRNNPFLPKDYIKSLEESYPPELCRAYIDGQFVNLTSGTVYSSYDKEAHDSMELPRLMPIHGAFVGETLFVGMDFNVMHCAAGIFVKRLRSDGKVGYDLVRALTRMYDTKDSIRTLKELYPLNKIVVYPDASGTARKTVDASVSDINLLKQAGFEVRVRSHNPPIKDRYTAVNVALSQGLIRVNSSTCPEAVESLTQQSFDKNGLPDKSYSGDHLNDAIGYFIAYEFPIKRPGYEIKFG